MSPETGACARPIGAPTTVASIPFERLAKLLANDPDLPCDLAPANLVLWRDCEAPTFSEAAGCLCVRLVPHAPHASAHFLEPIPADSDADVPAAIDACLAATPRVSRVRASVASKLAPGRYRVSPLRDHFDYVCESRRLAELSGAGYAAQRGQVRRFERAHPLHEFRPLSADDGPRALAVFDAWSVGRDLGGAPTATTATTTAATTISCQRRAIERAFESYAVLGLKGASVWDDGAMRGFLLASALGDTAFVHFLYAETRLPGAYQALVREACRAPLADHRFVNLEEDLGLPGLRRMKLAYRPVRMIEKAEVVPQTQA